MNNSILQYHPLLMPSQAHNNQPARLCFSKFESTTNDGRNKLYEMRKSTAYSSFNHDCSNVPH